MIHLADLTDDEGIDALTLSPLLAMLGTALLAARALFPGCSARQSLVGGHRHADTMCVRVELSASGNDRRPSLTSERNANHA